MVKKTRNWIGHDVPCNNEIQTMDKHYFDQFAEAVKRRDYWGRVVEASDNNPALKEALDRAQVIYELSRKNG